MFRKLILALAVLAAPALAFSQTVTTIPQLSAVSLPLSGSEVFPIYQGTSTKKVSVANLLSGSTVTSFSGGTTGLTPSSATTGVVTLAGNLLPANGGTGITSLGSGIAALLGTPSSANLRAALTDETGSGSAFFAGGDFGAATGSSVLLTGDAIAGSGAAVGWASRSRIYSAADGYIGLYNNAATDFTGLRFGGTSSSFPMLKRNGAALNARLADDSADASITAATATLGDNTTKVATTAFVQAAVSAASAVPTYQLLTSGTSFSTPAGARQLIVTIKGGGGGGSGTGSTGPNDGGTGGDSSFNGIVAKGGGGGADIAPGAGGTGGTGSALQRIAGQAGGGTAINYSGGTASAYIMGGIGGGQGGGRSSGRGGSAGGAGGTNTGGGGAGGSTTSQTASTVFLYYVGNGGGEGETVKYVLNNPTGSYATAIGAGGTAGTAGTGGAAGGAGAPGYILVEVRY